MVKAEESESSMMWCMSSMGRRGDGRGEGSLDGGSDGVEDDGMVSSG